MALEESKLESDKVEEIEGVSFLINEQDEKYFQEGVRIYMIQSPWFGTGLRIDLESQFGSAGC